MRIRLLYIFIALALVSTSSFAQVVNKELLQEDHSGIVSNSNYNSGADLKHEWLFQSIDGVKSTYKLRLSSGKTSKEFDVRVRNLLTTMYIAVRMTDSEGVVKTLTSIYDKGDKWQRVKMSPKQECLREDADWLRYYQIMSLQELLDNIVSQMDTNLVLKCYM